MRSRLSHFLFTHLPYQCGFKNRMQSGQCEVIVKFNKQQLSDFFNREASHFESLLTPF